jgi:hypothetical protein
MRKYRNKGDYVIPYLEKPDYQEDNQYMPTYIRNKPEIKKTRTNLAIQYKELNDEYEVTEEYTVMEYEYES